MIHKYYEVLCDYCGRTINHYPDRKPNNEKLRKDGIFITATKQFCNEICWGEWNHDRQEHQYMNLKQKGRIHNR